MRKVIATITIGLLWAVVQSADAAPQPIGGPPANYPPTGPIRTPHRLPPPTVITGAQSSPAVGPGVGFLTPAPKTVIVPPPGGKAPRQ